MNIKTKKIVSITKNKDFVPVYDLQTAKNHNFIVNETLVHNCILYQETLQMIYHKLAGVPLDETDMVRKAFTKKDIGNKEKAKAERELLKKEFIIKCKDANNIDEEISKEIFEELEKYVSYSFNKAHATAYSILSYQSSWLLTHYRDEWVASYIDYCATEKGKLTGKEDPKSIALREATKLGYKLGKPDINISNLNYVVHTKDNSKYLIPSFLSLTGIGAAAAKEVLDLRIQNELYSDVYSLFMKKDGTWKHSKFNKGALAALIQIEALESMDLVGKNKLFKNYRQLYAVAIENFDVIKRFFQRKNTTKQDVYNKIDELIEQSQSIEDWTMEEKKNFQTDIIGQYDIASTYDDEIFEQLEKSGVITIDQFYENPSKKGNLTWFFVQKAIVGKTRETKNTFLKVSALGEEGQQYTVFFWNASLTEKAFPREGDIMVATLKRKDDLISTNDNVVNSIVNRKVSLL